MYNDEHINCKDIFISNLINSIKKIHNKFYFYIFV